MLERETFGVGNTVCVCVCVCVCVDVLLAFYSNDLSYFPYTSALTCPGPDEIRCFFFCKAHSQGALRSGGCLFAYMMAAPRCVLTAFRITSLSWIIMPYPVLDFPWAHSMD